MGKRVFFVFLWLIIPFLLLSAGNERLTDDDAGQLLYSNYSDNGIMKGGVLVLQKVIREKTVPISWSAHRSGETDQFAISSRKTAQN